MVQEEDGGEGLVLGGGGDVALGGKMGEEGLNVGCAHFGRVAFVAEEDEAANPVYVGFFGAVGVVFGAQGVADLVQELFLGYAWFSPPVGLQFRLRGIVGKMGWVSNLCCLGGRCP